MNFFLLTNTDMQIKDKTTDPLVDYNNALSSLNLRFWSTISQQNWVTKLRNPLKTLAGDSFKDAEKIVFEQIEYEFDFKESGHKIPLGDLSMLFFNLLKAERNFGIVSSNTAHSMSAPLSRAAFLAHGWCNSTVKLLVNFDYHEDYGSGPTSFVVKSRQPDNGAWGQNHVCDDWAGIRNVTYIYVTIGNGQGGKIGCIKSLQYINDKPEKHTTTSYTAGGLRDLVNGPCDMYITIDRDVLPNGRTHFPVKGGLSVKSVKDYIEVIRASLAPKLLNVVGGDVTGLPKYDSSDKDAKSFNEAVEDIKELQKCITSLF